MHASQFDTNPKIMYMVIKHKHVTKSKYLNHNKRQEIKLKKLIKIPS